MPELAGDRRLGFVVDDVGREFTFWMGSGEDGTMP
jgi:hypothetical protein